MDLTIKPLNGEKTHPLKPPSIGALQLLMHSDIPIGKFNPGVRDRLTRENLVRVVMLPSPYANTAKGEKSPHFRITDAGRIALERLGK